MLYWKKIVARGAKNGFDVYKKVHEKPFFKHGATRAFKTVCGNQKGAIFGLDARIALAIFGLLSVVGGYSAIKVFGEARTTQLATELSNLKKAYQEFYLSTGRHTNNFMDLIGNESRIPGWAGPYTDLLEAKSRSGFGEYSFTQGRQDTNGAPPVGCDSDGICAVWLKLDRLDEEVALGLDGKLDGEDNPVKGVLRLRADGETSYTVWYLVTARY